jgi:spermidine/putrescine transport system substrate-binding protein
MIDHAPQAPEPGPAAGSTRRRFIVRAGAAAAGLTVPGLLAACGTTAPVAPGTSAGSSSGSASSAASLGPGGLALARPNHPVTLPLYADNKAIASGLKPEPGPLQFYNWNEYINPDVIKAFQRKYNVKVQVSTFTTIDEAVAKIASGQVQFDVFVPELVHLERLAVGKVLQPLNLSYIPNLKKNVWPSLNSPWYDVGAHYTVPYTIYTTGIGWRTDKLPGFSPAKYANPWTALWQEGPKISGRVGMLDDQHEGLTMGLLRDGVTDVNTESQSAVAGAQKALTQLVSAANLKFDTNEYQHLADGSLWLHQAWSGDMAAAPSYAPKGVHPSAFGYWWPTDGRGPIDNDTMAVLKGAKNPVLAHLFLNHVLDESEAFKNYSYVFYQQPLNAMTPEAVVKKGLVAPNLRTTLIREGQFKSGYVQGPLSQQGETIWQNAWAAVKSS